MTRTRSRPPPILPTVLLALAALVSSPARAVDLGERFELHGYGDLAHTVANVDATGERLGARETSHNLSLVGIWQATDRTRVWGQLFRSSELGKVRVDWAFADYHAGSGQTWRAGRVRMPFGLHNESRDVQALRPSASMPFLYDEELALVDEAFDGASVEQRIALGRGSATIEVYAAQQLLSGGPQSARGAALGARVGIETPIDGLSFRLSGYAGRLRPDGADERAAKRGWAASARYVRDAIDLQAEVARGRLYERSVSTWYLQGALELSERWQAVTRLEHITTDTARRGEDAFGERRLIAGLAWRISPNFGLRLEQQFHRGHAMAVLHETLEEGEGRHRWTSTVLSANYQF